MVLPSRLPTILRLYLVLPSFNYYIFFVFSESVDGMQCRWSLFIVCVILNVNIFVFDRHSVSKMYERP